MTTQTDAVELKAVTGDIPSKLAKPPQKKSAKEKPPKTSFAGRIDEVTVVAEGDISMVLLDKREKRHTFSLGSANATSAAIAQLLCNAMAKKLKVNVAVAPTNASQIVSVALHAKK